MKARVLIPLLGLAACGVARADISYNYVDVGYGLTAFDVPAPLDDEGDGARVSASHMLAGPVFAFGSYSYTDLDGGIRFDDFAVGLGARTATGPDGSVFVTLGFLRTEVEVPGFDFNEDGYGVTVGYRAENHTPWEFLGTIDYVNTESNAATGVGVSLVYDATRRFSVLGGVRYFEDASQVSLGVRYFFDLNH